MSYAAAPSTRPFSRQWLALGAAATILVCGAFWIESPARSWLLDRVRPVSAAMQTEPDDRSPKSAPISSEAAVVAFGLIDVEGGEVRLSPQVPGKVTDVPVSDGSRVKAGDPLIKLRSVIAEERVAQAKVAMTQARLKLQVAHRAPKLYVEKIKEQQQAVIGAKEMFDGIKDAIDELERQSDETIIESRLKAEKHRLNGSAAKLEAEKRRLEQVKLMDPAEEIELAEADLAKAKSVFAEANEFLEQHTLSAPDGGVVLRVMVSKGQVLGNLMQPAILFRPDRKTVLRCEVNQEFADRVKVGSRAEIYADKLDGTKWRGNVTRLSDWIAPRRSTLDEPFEKNDVRTMEAIVEFTGEAPKLRQGQRLRVVFLQ
jgi:multidrug resistance efflux pump